MHRHAHGPSMINVSEMQDHAEDACASPSGAVREHNKQAISEGILRSDAKRFVPFSQAGRDCVGQALARLNMATTLAQLWGNFTFRCADQVMPYIKYYSFPSPPRIDLLAGTAIIVPSF